MNAKWPEVRLQTMLYEQQGERPTRPDAVYKATSTSTYTVYDKAPWALQWHIAQNERRIVNAKT
jgi:hypothetical protein